MSAADKVNNVSVFLIKKKDFAKYKDLVVDSLTTNPIELKEGELFYRTSEDDYYPSWVDRFFGADKLGEDKKKLSTRNLSAVFFTQITVKGEIITFAVAFGNGRYLIKKDFIQHDFGLITSRHAIDASRINCMRTTTYDGNIKDKTIRSVDDIRQSDFFLNTNTDVLTAVSGKVRGEKTGDLLKDRPIGGKNSVMISAYVDVNNLKEFLGQLYTQYVSDGAEGVRYESNIKQLETEEEISSAEQLLQKAIDNHDKEDGLFLNLPIDDLERKEKIIGFTIEGDEYKKLTKDIFKKYTTVKELKEITASVKFEDEEDGMKYTLFDFIYAELEQAEQCFILADRKFFRVAKGYKQRVEDFYKDVKVETITGVTEWDGRSEGDYNENQKDGSILVLDEKFVYPEHRDRFEVCDLLTNDKHIVHVKIFGVASQPLGHLFNQGMLSAQCMADDEIRPLIQDKIKEVQTKGAKLNDFSIEPGFKPEDYTVTFLILCSGEKKIDTDGRPKIPFLAKAVFKENCTIINGLGYKVTLACIRES